MVAYEKNSSVLAVYNLADRSFNTDRKPLRNFDQQPLRSLTRKDEKGPSAIGWISEFLTGCWENATPHFYYSSLSLVDFDFAPPSLFVQLTQAMMNHMRWMRSLKLM